MATPKLALPELANSAANQLLANQTFDRLDQLVQMRVLDKDLTAPPASPADGAAYIPAAGATGAWAGKSGQIAYWRTAAGAWAFLVPENGWSVWVTDEEAQYRRKGGAWALEGSGGSSGGGTAAPAAVVVETGTARTAALTDAGKYLRFTSASAVTFTVPPQSSVAWPADTEINIRRAAAGNLTLTAGAGVTLNAPSGGTLVLTDRMTVTLKRVAENQWDVLGQTVAV